MDSHEILKRIEIISNDTIIDEFTDLPVELIETLAVEYEKEVEIIKDDKARAQFKERPPVITIMGHVDHGKTTLLDAFRHSQKVKEEYGDITQAIGAFTFVTDSEHEITFIDTPGHEAFQNLRLRGAKTTDMIILVISAIESIQPQTIEVIQISQKLKIPVIVAINKIDRNSADPDAVMLDLATYDMIAEELGGDLVCVPISAKQKTNLDLLEQKIVEVAHSRVDLMEDFGCRAQCYIIESNFDEKSTQVTATVLVKKGTLNQDDIFVCGPHEGKVRFMRNDQGKNVKSAYPGQAVHLAGFKSFPEVGLPLYACKNHEEAQFMANRIQTRRDKEEQMKLFDDQLASEGLDMKKKIKGLTRMEKRKMYGGDKSIMYEKIGLVEESDIDKYRKKLGIKKNVTDLVSKDAEDVEDLVSEAAAVQMQGINSKTKHKGRQVKLKQFEQDEFKKILHNYQEEQKKREAMSPVEQARYDQERQKLKEVYRDEDVKHFPIMIKASQAGVLETLLKEAEKVVGTHNYRINIIDYSVGPVTEGDMNTALQTGAVIFGFDVPIAPVVSRTAESIGVCVKQHRIIYKFLEDVEHFVYDANTKIQEESGKAFHVEVVGTAAISQLFKIKDPKAKGNKLLTVAGCKVHGGDIERKYKFRVVRNGKILQDNIKLHSMKKMQQDVTIVEKGHECGLCLDNFDGELLPGDEIEAYKELEGKLIKFNSKPGIHQSY
eukprot:403365101